MKKRTYTRVPKTFPVCTQAGCKQAGSCLHRQAYAAQAESQDFFLVINPSRCTPEGDCAHFRPSAPQRYARGFRGMQKKMFPEQYTRFRDLLLRHFSRTTFYERRNGSEALSPKEQEIVYKALQEVGINEKFEFDSYEETNNWYD